MLCTLRNLLREDSMTGTYCAGYCASFAVCFLPQEDRVPIAVYMFVRALRVIGEGLCRWHHYPIGHRSALSTPTPTALYRTVNPRPTAMQAS